MIMLGLGLTRAAKFTEKMDRQLRYITGVFMILLGLWLLAAFKNTLTGF